MQSSVALAVYSKDIRLSTEIGLGEGCEGAARGNLLKGKERNRLDLFWHGHFQATKEQKRAVLCWQMFAEYILFVSSMSMNFFEILTASAKPQNDSEMSLQALIVIARAQPVAISFWHPTARSGAAGQKLSYSYECIT